MAIRTADAVWEGALESGSGTVSVESGSFEGSYSFASRFGDGDGTNPEELIGAAHAGCFSMALAHLLAEQGHAPTRIATSAAVQLRKAGEGFEISEVALTTRGEVPDIDADAFSRAATKAKDTCPVSKALSGVRITLEASLEE